jgi:hypothetical protein
MNQKGSVHEETLRRESKKMIGLSMLISEIVHRPFGNSFGLPFFQGYFLDIV